ncbi:tRNA (guanosine(37)-N1)-methyltransferase TrmD [Patescibacteria group bacterium]|nr:tRNA (guanosine(37)-N1)-methyltransferase TrmD [Patescibacteria group bacterium]
MQFDIITIFPEMFSSYFNESILGRAQKKNLVKIKIYNLRKYTNDKHKTTDDTPYGGGAGMVLKLEPIYNALRDISVINVDGKRKKTHSKTRIFLMSAKGAIYNQKTASCLADLDRIVLICGRYEGVDERVKENLIDGEISIGKYILMGGELASMIIVDSVSRLVEGVLGNEKSLESESYSNGLVEHPHYTKPESFLVKKGLSWKVPDVLLSGNHRKIEEWRKKHSKIIED